LLDSVSSVFEFSVGSFYKGLRGLGIMLLACYFVKLLFSIFACLF